MRAFSAVILQLLVLLMTVFASGKSYSGASESISSAFHLAARNPTSYPTRAVSDCPAGSAGPVGGNCTTCSAGYFASAGSTSCSECQAGFISDADASECSACSFGTYSSSPASPSCSDCDIGYVAPALNSTSCYQCSAGTYASDAVDCIECPSGSVSPAGSSSVTDCVSCGAGYYAEENSAECSECPGGYYSGVGATSCIGCPAGTYSTSNSSQCTACTSGYISTANSSFCSECPAGTYAFDAVSCFGCTAGTYSVSGSTSCTVCPVGYISPANSSVCTECSAGTYASGGVECLVCHVGYISPAGSNTVANCTACTAGFYTGPDSDTCSECDAGTYSSEAATSCTDCEAGTYSLAGSGQCTACPTGWVSSEESGACVQCPVGTYANVSVCEECSKGTYADSPGSVECLLCPSGYVGPSGSSSSTNCTECPEGTYAPTLSDECTVCEAGSVSAAGSSNCTQCAAGTYASAAGDSCIQCYLGSISVAGSTNCTACPPGYASDNYVSCTQCGPGQYAATNGSSCPNCGYTICLDCAANTYSAGSANTYCSYCDAGTYSTAGSSDCLSCPPGWGSKEGGNCFTCPAGYYSGSGGGGEGGSSCKLCPASRTVSNVGTSSQGQCTNPVLNFITAFITFGFAMFTVALYIIGGRLQRMSFVRKERLVKKSALIYDMAYEQLMIAYSLCRAISDTKPKNNKTTMAKIGKILIDAWLLFVLMIVGLLVFILFFLAAVLRIIFTAMILWRGYNLDVSFMHLVSFYLSQLSIIIRIPGLKYLFYPFVFVFNFVASISIDLGAARVNCLGCQAAMHLFLDFLITGVIVIIVQSDMEVFWSTSMMRVNEQYLTLLLQAEFWRKTKRRNVFYLVGAIVLAVLPHPRKLLQYTLGFVRVLLFFQQYGHAQYSDICTYKGQPIDRSIALLTTAMAYLAIFPVIYLMSHVLVPRFKLQHGTVKTQRSVRTATARNAAKKIDSQKCGKCKRGLHRHYSNHFGELHCDHLQHKSPVGQPVRDFFRSFNGKYYVVYGCSAMTKCNWCMCNVCYRLYVAKYAKAPPMESMESHSPVAVPDIALETGESFRTTSVTSDTSYTPEEDPEKEETLLTTFGSLKILAIFASFDWFYIKSIFVFGKSLFGRIKSGNAGLLFYYNSKLGRSSYGEQEDHTLPVLPWFYALRKNCTTKERIELENRESKAFDRNWSKATGDFPSYYRLVVTVQDDLTPKHQHIGYECSECGVNPIVGKRFVWTRSEIQKNGKRENFCEYCKFLVDKYGEGTEEVYDKVYLHFYYKGVGVIAWLFAWTFPGQLMSERGRLIWTRVFRNYYVFMKVAVGFWNDKGVRDFELIERFREQDEESDAIQKSHDAYLRKQGVKPQEKQPYYTLDRLNLLAAMVSSRVVLIQLLPYLTLVSTLAVDISASPIFIFNSALVDKLPPFIMVNAEEEAKKSLTRMGNDHQEWKVTMMTFYLIVEQSRSIQFAINLFSNLIAVLVVFSHSNSHVTIAFMVLSGIVFLFTSFVLTIYPFILLHKLLYPPENNTRNGDDEVRQSVVGVMMTNVVNPLATTEPENSSERKESKDEA